MESNETLIEIIKKKQNINNNIKSNENNDYLKSTINKIKKELPVYEEDKNIESIETVREVNNTNSINKNDINYNNKDNIKIGDNYISENDLEDEDTNKSNIFLILLNKIFKLIIDMLLGILIISVIMFSFKVSIDNNINSTSVLPFNVHDKNNKNIINNEYSVLIDFSDIGNDFDILYELKENLNNSNMLTLIYMSDELKNTSESKFIFNLLDQPELYGETNDKYNKIMLTYKNKVILDTILNNNNNNKSEKIKEFVKDINEEVAFKNIDYVSQYGVIKNTLTNGKLKAKKNELSYIERLLFEYDNLFLSKFLMSIGDITIKKSLKDYTENNIIDLKSVNNSYEIDKLKEENARLINQIEEIKRLNSLDSKEISFKIDYATLNKEQDELNNKLDKINKIVEETKKIETKTKIKENVNNKNNNEFESINKTDDINTIDLSDNKNINNISNNNKIKKMEDIPISNINETDNNNNINEVMNENKNDLEEDIIKIDDKNSFVQFN